MARQQTSSHAGSLMQHNDLLKRLFFTLGALVIVRCGGFIPLPGVAPEMIAHLLPSAGGPTALGSEAARRVSIFAIGVVPYVSACLIVYTFAGFWQYLRSLRWAGVDGQRRLNQYIRVVAIALAAFQSFGLAGALEGVHGLVSQPGLGFRVGATMSLVAGSAFLIWLGEEISRRGVGDGVWLIFAAGTIGELPRQALAIHRLYLSGAVPAWAPIASLAAIAALVALVVFAEKAVRVVRVAGQWHEPIRLRLNPSGILAPMLASVVLPVPLLAAWLTGFGGSDMKWLASLLAPGQLLSALIYTLLIVFFAFFYAAAAFDPRAMAANRTASSPAQLDTELARVTALGAPYLVVLCLVPDLMNRASLPFPISGPSILITVLVAMDVLARWQQARRVAVSSTGTGRRGA